MEPFRLGVRVRCRWAVANTKERVRYNIRIKESHMIAIGDLHHIFVIYNGQWIVEHGVWMDGWKVGH